MAGSAVFGVRRGKAALSSGCKAHPANAPAGSNRSSYGGDEIAEAFGMRATNWWQRECAGRNASERRASLVWGSRSQALISRILHFLFSTSFIPVSLFDLESRFFAPTHTCWRPARTGAVKVGRRYTLAARSSISRPRLDRPEHGGPLVVVGMTRPRGVRCQGTRNSRRNLVSGGSQ